MPAPGLNPVLAPIRRWVLYSRTHLAITITGFVALLFVAGTIFNQTPPQPSTAAAEGIATTVEVAPGPGTMVEPISYELDEVAEAVVATKPASWSAARAPATAMAYVHAFVDPAPSDTAWVATLGRYTDKAPDETTVSARPRIPVVITGPTSSRLDERAGTGTAHVIVPTQVGDMQIALTVADGDRGKRWVVTAPLPSLDLGETRSNAPSVPSPVMPTTPYTTTPPTFEVDIPTSSRADLPTPAGAEAEAPAPVPVPVPGPIPIPELDTPIPGKR